MNGVDVSRLQVGDVLELDAERATMMVENGWAEIPLEVKMPRPQKCSESECSDQSQQSGHVDRFGQDVIGNH
jgi:hypothetical protein